MQVKGACFDTVADGVSDPVGFSQYTGWSEVQVSAQSEQRSQRYEQAQQVALQQDHSFTLHNAFIIWAKGDQRKKTRQG